MRGYVMTESEVCVYAHERETDRDGQTVTERDLKILCCWL